jgi:uncharacterized membrane protein YgcG
MKVFRTITANLLVIGILILPSHSSAQNPQNFTFESFEANYYLDQNSERASTLRVNESLVAVFPNSDQNHGILRAIPESYNGHTLSLKNISVTNESGKAYQFTTSSQNGNKVLKIGNPNQYAHGRTIYKINYEVQDVTSYFSDHDELFWDINGDQWNQPFATVTANIHIAKKLVNSLQDRRLCYAGIHGGTAGNCSITLVSPPNETYIAASANSLQPRQTLSVVLAFKPGTFNQKSSAIKKEEHSRKVKLIVSAVLGIIPPLFAFIFMFRRWRKFGDDPKGRGVIIPEYEPPKGFDTLSSDFLLHQKLRNKAFSAMLIEQAVNGNIAIIEIPKKGIFGKTDYELQIKNNPNSPVLSPETVNGLKAIFGGEVVADKKIKLSDIKKSTVLRQQMYESMKRLEKALSAKLTAKGYFKKDPKSIRNTYIGLAAALVFFAFASVFIAGSLNSWVIGSVTGGLIFAAIIVFIFSFIMPARTDTGVAAHDALLGLKDYIKLAETERLKFLQSPKGAEKLPVADEFNPKTAEAKVKLFEKLLPYAMLFGLEKDWAKQFNDIYTTPPSWYQGNWSAFNAGYLAGSLSDFSAASGVSFASPSSSSGSGFSGGGSGGGGGGGGGGGW